MNTKYTLKNFRVFDEQGATFELAPVTILTGCNSSGKSSIAKSLMLLKPLMSKYKDSILSKMFNSGEGGFSFSDLDFTIGKHNLGNFEKVINWNSDKEEFSIAVEVYSVALHRPMTISFTFANTNSKEKEQTFHANLCKVEISAEGRLFYCYKDTISEPTFINLSDWREEIIKVLHDNSVANTIAIVQNDNNDEEIEPLKTYFTSLDARCSLKANQLFVEWQKKHLEECKHIGNVVDFPYGHIYSLGKLMDDLNSISKENILKYTEDRFVNDENVRNAWFNDDYYKNCIHDIFSEFISSKFEKFSDFYYYYEGFKLLKAYTRFSNVSFDHDQYLGIGTASPILHSLHFIGNKKKWSESSPLEKFHLIFYCLQGFGGYRTEYESIYNIPQPLPISQLEIIQQYTHFACEEILMKCCNFIAEAEFIELNRSHVQRIYSFDAQETSFNRILDMFHNIDDDTFFYLRSEQDEEGQEYAKGTFAEKWISKLTGFSGFSLKQAPEGAGYYVYLKKDNRLVSLADVGYGVTPLISMLLHIEIAICRYLEKDFQERVTICIEEPESNLHPSVQAKLADMFADAAEHYPVNFILETHSEYLVRRSQVIVAEQHYEDEETLKEKCPFKVYYMPRPDDGKPYDLEYKLDGKFRKKFGKGFFDIADSLALELL